MASCECIYFSSEYAPNHGTLPHMGHSYDLFEKYPDGSCLWIGSVEGRENAIHKLHELAAATPNECFIMDLTTHTAIASMNASKSESASL